MAVLLFFLLCAPSSVQVRVTFFSTLRPFALSHFAKRERHRRRCRGYMRAPGPGGGVPMQNGTAAPPQLDVFCLFFYLYWFLFSSLPRFLLFLKRFRSFFPSPGLFLHFTLVSLFLVLFAVFQRCCWWWRFPPLKPDASSLFVVLVHLLPLRGVALRSL